MELIERLKALIAKLESLRGNPAKYLTVDAEAEMGRIVWDHSEEVIAALQLAEDLEKIYEVSGEFRIRKHSGFVPEIEYRSSIQRVTGDDIYTAARKAVEALRAAKEGA